MAWGQCDRFHGHWDFKLDGEMFWEDDKGKSKQKPTVRQSFLSVFP